MGPGGQHLVLGTWGDRRNCKPTGGSGVEDSFLPVKVWIPAVGESVLVESSGLGRGGGGPRLCCFRCEIGRGGEKSFFPAHMIVLGT